MLILLAQVVAMLNQRFHFCLSHCKQLNGQSLSSQLGDSSTAQLTADKLLYNHAIELVRLPFHNLDYVVFHLIIFPSLFVNSSANPLRWMSCLVIRPAVAVATKRPTSYFTVLPSR